MKQLPYGTQTNWKILHDAQRWCRDQWGPRWQSIGNREGTWCVVWAGTRIGDNLPSTYQWWFETEQQRSWFLLRWS